MRLLGVFGIWGLHFGFFLTMCLGMFPWVGMAAPMCELLVSKLQWLSSVCLNWFSASKGGNRHATSTVLGFDHITHLPPVASKA